VDAEDRQDDEDRQVKTAQDERSVGAGVHRCWTRLARSPFEGRTVNESIVFKYRRCVTVARAIANVGGSTPSQPRHRRRDGARVGRGGAQAQQMPVVIEWSR
jgi:hypothetical protein